MNANINSKTIILLLISIVVISGCALKTNKLLVESNFMRVSSSDLMWQKERGPLFTTWKEANEYVQKLELAGYDDWRLPTKEEFRKLYFYFDFGSANAKEMGIVIEGNYWSADENGQGFTGAWEDGEICEIQRDYKPAVKGYVRAVRP